MRLHFSAALLALAIGAPARAELVVVVHPKSRFTTLSSEQVTQIYLGRSEVLEPIERSDNPELRSEFYGRVTGKSLAQVKAIWSKLIFTGRATPPVEVAGGDALKRAVARNPNAIGYLEARDVDASVRTLTITP